MNGQAPSSNPVPKIFFLLLMLSLVLGGIVAAAFGLTREVMLGLAAAIIAAPIVEYAIHRFVSHNLLLCRTRFTAAIWRRIHWAHHHDPFDSSVIFGTPQHVIPGSIFFATPVGWLAGGLEGASAAIAFGLFHAGIVELVHANSHLPVLPDWRYFRYLKRLHLLHHYRNETVNFGVTSPLCDVMFGTYHAGSIGEKKLPQSPTVRNLGYDANKARLYPWLGEPDAKQYSNNRQT